MKSITLFILVTFSFSSCIIEMELGEPFVNIRNINEYETKEIVQEIWSGRTLVYEESIYHAWLDIEFQNTGGIRATDISAEIIFYDHHREIRHIEIYIPDISAGNSYTYSLDTGFESNYDYSDYEVSIYWE